MVSPPHPNRRTVLSAALAGGTAALLPGLPARASAAGATHAIAMHGAPALPADFPHLPYVRPDAPKGGRINVGLVGSFDNLNPFIVRGQAVGAIRTFVYESLLTRSQDEAFSLYGFVAQSIEVPEDRSSITFHLDPQAAFADGRPITVADVEFSWNQLRAKGWPNLRTYYNKVEAFEQTGERSFAMRFPGAQDRELPLILGLMPILPRHAINPETFEQTTLEPPLGSGPYTVAAVQPGDSVLLARNPNWWARNKPVARGLYNFDEIRIEFFRDVNILFEAFKKGLVDVRFEDDPNRWANAYDFPAVRERRVVLESFPVNVPRPTFGFVYNTRRPVFANPAVREGLVELFDFEWINANLFAGGFRRTGSFFQGSELSALGRPANDTERRLLAPFSDRIRPEVMEGRWQPPQTDGSGFDRNRIRRGLDLLRTAGYTARDGRLRDQRGQPLAFEAMFQLAEHERVLLAWKRVLDRVGIELSMRRVDSAQWERRRQTFDFDMMPWAWGGTLSPGNEQAFRWGTRSADAPGSLNLAGVREPGVDAMVEATLAARTREELVSAARALDRLLISGFYILPLYHMPEQRVARWAYLGRPDRVALTGQVWESWWREPS